MAATSFSPRDQLSPEQVIAGHAGAMQAICTKLVSRVEHVEKENAKIGIQLGDALDKVYELETKLREKDQIIEELQAMSVSATTRKKRA